jgi:DNA replication protein DnaC
MIAMARADHHLPTQLDQDLADLKLLEIAQNYRAVLDEAARKGRSMLEVLTTLVGMEQTVRLQRALERRLRQAHLPKQKTLADYAFDFPKRIPKTAIVRLFDCDFIDRHGCAVLIGPTGTGKTHLLTALGYKACECGYSVCYTRVVDMLNRLTTAQINGRLAKALKTYVRPQLLLLDELGYLPIDKRGADLLFQVVAARYEAGSIVLTTNRAFREWGTLFDVDNTLATALIDRLMHHGEALVINPNGAPSLEKGASLRIQAAAVVTTWEYKEAHGHVDRLFPTTYLLGDGYTTGNGGLPWRTGGHGYRAVAHAAARQGSACRSHDCSTPS